jgi:hypothetical protein
MNAVNDPRVGRVNFCDMTAFISTLSRAAFSTNTCRVPIFPHFVKNLGCGPRPLIVNEKRDGLFFCDLR